MEPQLKQFIEEHFGAGVVIRVFEKRRDLSPNFVDSFVVEVHSEVTSDQIFVALRQFYKGSRVALSNDVYYWIHLPESKFLLVEVNNLSDFEGSARHMGGVSTARGISFRISKHESLW